jgi:hypothetical protein
MSSETDPVGSVLGQERIRAASTVVLGVAALVLLLVLVSLLPVPLSPAATGSETTALGLLGVLGLGLFGYIGWGVATLVHADAGIQSIETGTAGSLVQWTVVLTVMLLVYTGLGPVVSPSLGGFALAYDLGFLLVAAVPVVAIGKCLGRRSGENSFAEKIEAVREDLRGDSTDDGASRD